MKRIAIPFACAALALASCSSSKEQHAQKHQDDPEVCERDGVAMTPVPAEANAPQSEAKAQATAGEAQVATAHFGREMALSDADAVPVEKVLATPNEYKGKRTRITGKVGDVCPKKGCWMRVIPASADAGGENIFIKFRDPAAGMLIPLEAVGKNVTVEGELKVGMISEAAARHFKYDAGAPQEEIEKIVGPQKQAVLADPAVLIEGVTKTVN